MTEQIYQQNFGEWMREQRDELGVKQSDLAARLGVSDRSVQNWERGLARMSAYTERRIRAVFRQEREVVAQRKQVTV